MSDGWTEPQSWPALATGEVHVWLAHLPSARGELEQLTALLTSEERERAARFRTWVLRERWALARAILRSLLARYAGVGAQEIIFQLGAHGKPAFAPPGDPGLHFNTSHSGDHAAFAFTRAGEVGVDIEEVRGEMRRHEAIAQRFFTPGERAALASMAEAGRLQAFFEFWTRKEAFVKARGDGVFSGLEKFEVSLREPRVLNVTGGEAADWWMTKLPELENYAGAVVVKAGACRPQFWRWNARGDRSTVSNRGPT